VSWLGVLLAGAGQEELRAHRDTLLQGAEDAATRARVAAEAVQAEALRVLLSDHTARVGELGALYDLALRLSGVHDLAPLLQDTVTQASRLLEVDVAYLSLVEEDGSQTIRFTEGSLGPLLRGVSLPPRSGLAGRVLETGALVESIDYLGDPALTHQEAVDRVAGAEGLRTILGVPLRVREEVIGTLMVAQREVRSFSENARSLLSSFAALASVAIDNARLLEDHRRAADDLSAVNQQLRTHVESVNRAVLLHDDLLHVALRGDGVEEVLVSLSDVVRGMVSFVDAEDRVLCSAYAGGVKSGAAMVPLREGAPSRVFRESGARHTRQEEEGTTVPVASADTYFGALQVVPEVDISDFDIRMLERAAMTIALVMSTERAVSDADRRSTTELLEQLVTRQLGDESAFTRRARSLGFDLAREHLVVVVDADPDVVETGVLRLGDLAQQYGGVAGRVLGHLVAIVRCDDEDVRQLAAGRPSVGTIGFAGPASGASGLAGAYDDARACVAVLHGLDRSGSCANAADLGPFRFLLSRAARSDAQRFVRATIGPLIDHDRDRKSELVKTATVFLSSGRQHAGTAKALHVHGNTLYQRLDRITALLGEEWRVGDRALDVQMALRLHELSTRFEGSEDPS
jgi:hypothetical protein